MIAVELAGPSRVKGGGGGGSSPFPQRCKRKRTDSRRGHGPGEVGEQETNCLLNDAAAAADCGRVGIRPSAAAPVGATPLTPKQPRPQLAGSLHLARPCPWSQSGGEWTTM